MSFAIIKKNYDRGLWSEAMVALAVVKGIITAEEYTKITGLEY